MKRSFMLILCILCLLPLCALGESTATDLTLPVAEEITKEVSFKGGNSMHLLTDGRYGKVWTSRRVNGQCPLTVVAPEGKSIGAVQIYWRFDPLPVTLQAPDGNGGWTDIATVEGGNLQPIYQVGAVSEVRIVHTNEPLKPLEIYEIKVFTPGTLPNGVHVWQDSPEKVDMMLLHGHPDDEVLWFGGLLPTYACQLEKDVLVVCSTPVFTGRMHELLDSLWTCGVRIFPVFGDFDDKSGLNRRATLKEWGEDAIISFVTEMYRKYKPDVVVTHDVEGEYGHGVHKALCWACQQAIVKSPDASCFPEQVERYGVWDVPKMYIHLYAENQITMDWWQPLSAFDGKTSQDVARDAFACHVSQQKSDRGRSWAVLDHGTYDNSLFGLYYTTVGPDVKGGDMFENLPQE